MNEQEISIKLSQSLGEWGVSKDRAHAAFRKDVIMVGIEYSRTQPDPVITNFQPLRNDEFPTDIDAAYEHFLRHEDAIMPLFCYEDKINMDAREPYVRWFNTKTRKIDYRLKSKFQGMPRQDLDPLKRFHFEEMSITDHFFSKWLVDSGNNTEIGEKLMTAYLTCHVLQHEKCFHCNSKKSLRWNGNFKASWKDFVCLKCNVMYKVKTKASQKDVETAFRSNSFGGGSFQQFCEIRNSQAKLFLVILPRRSIVNGKQNSVYPVNVAEIMNGVPQLYHGTFNKRLPSLRFKTMVSVYPGTQKKWFDLPFRQITVDVGAVGKKIFIERFSKKSYTDMAAMYFEDADSEDESCDSSADDVLIDSIAEITKGIGDIKK
eukprot:scaffold2293_cov248-Chaetoceros_neogracile.AAC.2